MVNGAACEHFLSLFWSNKRPFQCKVLSRGKCCANAIVEVINLFNEWERDPERFHEIKRCMHRDPADLWTCLFVLMSYIWIQKGSKGPSASLTTHTYTNTLTVLPQISRALISLSLTDSDCAPFEKSEWVCWLETALTYKSAERNRRWFWFLFNQPHL